MKYQTDELSIGIIGGGPAALFLLQELVEQGTGGMRVTIYERSDRLGAGMPYSNSGANEEHSTNVSGNELPDLPETLQQWLERAPDELLQRFAVDRSRYSDYRVLPRLLFGHYLEAQFHLVLDKAAEKGIEVQTLLHCTVDDVRDEPDRTTVHVRSSDGEHRRFSAVVLCTGHHWPKKTEGSVPNYFDSPYPPQKLAAPFHDAIAIRGSSLTAIDAVRTLAAHNGSFLEGENGALTFQLKPGSEGFRIVLHSLGGFLPAVRMHLEDSHLSHDTALDEEAVQDLMRRHEGFVPLDELFQIHFLELLRRRDPAFYERVRDLRLEEFVAAAMDLRERLDPFLLLRAELAEAEKSIRRQQPVAWKEALAVLSYALNYPAKHLSAEDMLRLKRELMPLIALVIAFVPQRPARELLALHDAGVLDMIAVDRASTATPRAGGGVRYTYTDADGNVHGTDYEVFIDAVGQAPLPFEALPFASLRHDGSLSPARLRFRSITAGAAEKEAGNKDVEQDPDGQWHLRVPGATINDHFQALDRYGAYSDRIYLMAVPLIAGLNPDYSGLDFCEAAAKRIVPKLIAPISLPDRA